jgi:hypothetical protein
MKGFNNALDGMGCRIPGYGVTATANFAVIGWSANLGSNFGSALAWWNHGNPVDDPVGQYYSFGISEIASNIALGPEGGPYNDVFGLTNYGLIPGMTLGTYVLPGSQGCLPAPTGLVSWWQGQNNANDIIGTNNGTLQNGVGFTNGEVGQAFSFNGSNQCVRIPYSPSLGFTTYTVETWIKPTGPVNDPENQAVVFAQGNGLAQLLVRTGVNGVLVAFQFGHNGGFYAVVSTEIPIGQFTHVAGTWDGTTLSLYTNGVLSTQVAAEASPADSGCDFFIGGFNNSCGYVGQYFNGLVDEVSYYNRALSLIEVQSIFSAGSAGKCFFSTNFVPTIISQPQSLIVGGRALASFSVIASGPQLNYQWLLNGTNIPGATTNTLTIPSVTQTNLGNYTVLVTNSFGSVLSSNATLSMYPFIATPFPGAVTYWGKDAILNVQAWGTGPLTYQWFDNGVAIVNATNAALELTSVQFTNAGLYTVVITSPLGSVTNIPAQVVVNPAGVSLGMYPGVTVSGVVGYTYVIQSTTGLTDTNWSTVATLTLTQPVQLWVDVNANAAAPENQRRFYRVLPGP